MAEVTGLRNNALPYPVYGAPWGVVFPMLDADGDLVTGATTPDAERSLNGDTFADCTNESVEIATASGVYYLLLTAAEMTADVVAVIAKSATAGMKTTVLTFYPAKLPTLRAGTVGANAADGTTLQLDSSASAVDDFYTGCLIVATIDTVVEARVIADYVGSTKVCTISPAFVTAAPDTTDTFVVYQPWGRQVVEAHVNAIAASAITATSIATAAITSAKFAAGAIDAAAIADAAIDAATFAAGAITATAIATDAIGAAEIADGAITAATFAAGAIDATAIAAGAIDAATFAAGAIDAAAIADGAIDANTFAAGAITANAIATDAIGAAELADGAITAATFAAGAIDATAIAAGAIDAATFAAGAIDAAAIADGAIDAATFAAGAITATVIADGAIDAATFAAGAITATAIAADAIGASELAADAVAEIADGVWDEVTSGHTTVGTFGQRNYLIRAETAQAGAGTTITLDASASAVDDFYNNTIIVLTAGTGAGQARFISDYVGATKVASVPAWATNPDNTSVFVIMPFGAIPGATAPTAAEVADAVWDEDATGHQTGGTFGQAIGDPGADTTTIYQSVVTDAAGTNVAADVIAVKAETASIQSDTNDIQARLPAALVGGRIDASVGAIAANAITATSIAADAITAAKVADGTIDAATFAAGAITAAAIADAAIDRATFAADTGLQTIRSNTAAAGGATTITLDAGASAVDDFYNNCLILLTGGTGVGGARFISDYVGGTQVATVAAWATAPDNTSTFAILPFDAVAGASAPTAAQVATAVWQDATAGDFTAASSIGRSLYTAGALPGAAGGHFIAGTNAATVVTTSLTTTFTGNLTGSVGSVTGAVGSVTGAVGSVAAGGITAASIATDAIDADAMADGAITAATFAAGAITATVIATDAIDADALADGAIDANTFAAGAITATAIAANAIGASELAADAVAEIADGILDRDMSTGTDSGSTTVRTPRQALRSLRNNTSIVAGVLTVTKEDDTTASWTAAVTTDAAADLVTAVDPAGP